MNTRIRQLIEQQLIDWGKHLTLKSSTIDNAIAVLE